MENSNNSGVNTVILVLILGIIVFALVWFFKGGAAEPQQEGLNVELNIPTEEDNGGGNGGGG